MTPQFPGQAVKPQFPRSIFFFLATGQFYHVNACSIAHQDLMIARIVRAQASWPVVGEVCCDRTLLSCARLSQVRAQGMSSCASARPGLYRGLLCRDNEFLCRDRTRSSAQPGSSVVARMARNVQCLVATGISCLRPTPVATETQKWAVAHPGPLHLRLPFSFLSKIP